MNDAIRSFDPSENPTTSRVLSERAPWLGRTIGGYEILSLIGQGGMGDVYLAYDVSLQRRVAIKVLPDELTHSTDFVARFRTEAAAIAQVNDPHVVPIHRIGEDQGCPYFVMPFIDGDSLAQRLQSCGRLPVETAIGIVEDVLAGLSAAHRQGLIHRDIKPGNILLERPHDRALIVDFGLVKSQETQARLTITGVVLGTVDYIAPEQARGQTVDTRCDLYAVGVVLYEMLSGRLPFAADSPTGMIFQHVYEPPPPLQTTNPALWRIVAKLMAKDASRRYSTADDVRNDLHACHEGQPLPSGAEQEELRTYWSAASLTRRVDRESLLVTAPEFTDDPLTGGREVPVGRWQQFLHFWDFFQQSSLSEWCVRLSATQQQVDDAICDYQQRREQLCDLIRLGESVLLEWQRLDARQDDVEITTASAIAQQSQQLDAMRVQLAKVDATLLRLVTTRDELQVRLKVAQTRLHARPGAVRIRRLAVALMCGLVIVGWGGWYWFSNATPSTSMGTSTSQPTVSAATPDSDRAFYLTETPTKSLFQLDRSASPIMFVSFSTDGELTYLGDERGNVNVLDSTRGQRLGTFSMGVTGNSPTITDPTGNLLARRHSSETIVELRLSADPQTVTTQIPIEVDEVLVAVQNDPPAIWTLAQEAEASILRRRSISEVETRSLSTPVPLASAWLNTDQQLLVALEVGDEAGCVVYDLSVAQNSLAPQRITAGVKRMAVRQTGQPVVAIVADSMDRVVVWDAISRAPAYALHLAGGEDSVSAIRSHGTSTRGCHRSACCRVGSGTPLSASSPSHAKCLAVGFPSRRGSAGGDCWRFHDLLVDQFPPPCPRP